MAKQPYPLNGMPVRGSDPASDAAAITPSDTTDLPVAARAIYVGVSGDVTLDTYDGTTQVLFKNAQQGTVIPIVTKRVRATGTTATNLVALY